MAKYGIDVASYQTGLKMSSTNDNNDFVIIKASEGNYYKYSQMKDIYKDAKNNKLKVGFYHFARFDINSGKTEANYFYNTIKSTIKEGDAIFLDYEAQSLNHAPKIDDFLSSINNLFDKKIKCGLYCSESVFNSEHLANHVKKDTPLWIAKYSSYEPSLYTGFWDMWQYRDDYSVGGYITDRNKLITNWGDFAMANSNNYKYYLEKLVVEKVSGNVSDDNKYAFQPNGHDDQTTAYICRLASGLDPINIFLDSELTKTSGKQLHRPAAFMCYPTKSVDNNNGHYLVMKTYAIMFGINSQKWVFIKYRLESK